MVSPEQSMAHATVLAGRNPILYSESNPVTLFLVQIFLIVVMCRLVHIPLSYLHQPRVVSEVLTGVILGKLMIINIKYTMHYC